MSGDIWTGARTIAKAQQCYFCRAFIPRCKPGATSGSRGVKAWWSQAARLWQCNDCMAEQTRSELARLEILDAGG